MAIWAWVCRPCNSNVRTDWLGCACRPGGVRVRFYAGVHRHHRRWRVPQHLQHRPLRRCRRCRWRQGISRVPGCRLFEGFRVWQCICNIPRSMTRIQHQHLNHLIIGSSGVCLHVPQSEPFFLNAMPTLRVSHRMIRRPGDCVWLLHSSGAA